MTDMIFIKPAKSVKVRDPQSGEHLLDTGEAKPRTRYWLRRLKDGDVVEAQPPKSTKKATSKE